MLPATPGAPPAPAGASRGRTFSVANLSGPSADRPARSAMSCCDAWRNDTLNAPLFWMSLQVRLPGCSAIATIGGSNETYIAVPVAQDRSAPCAAPMIATPCGIRERAVRATAYRSPVFSAMRPRLAGMVEWSDNSAGPARGARGRREVAREIGLRATSLGHRAQHGCRRRLRWQQLRNSHADTGTEQGPRRVRQRGSGGTRAA